MPRTLRRLTDGRVVEVIKIIVQPVGKPSENSTELACQSMLVNFDELIDDVVVDNTKKP